MKLYEIFTYVTIMVLSVIILMTILLEGISLNSSNEINQSPFNDSFLSYYNITQNYFIKSNTPQNNMIFQVIAREASYNNSRIEINMSHIASIDYKGNMMIIQTRN